MKNYFGGSSLERILENVDMFQPMMAIMFMFVMLALHERRIFK